MNTQKKLNHLAIIIDGNGRWAKNQQKPRSYGHKIGYEKVIKLIEWFKESDISVLSVYCFSIQNQKRPQSEVKFLHTMLFKIIKKFFHDETTNNSFRNSINNCKIKIKFCGEEENIDSKLLEQMKRLEDFTKEYKNKLVNICFNYGGQEEILNAANKSMSISQHNIKNEEFIKYFWTYDSTFKNYFYVDLLVRTGGEFRISNFLLWECAYTEFLFLAKYWPAFTKFDFLKSINTYYQRHRKFGNIS